jgi:hypothetical protein
MISISLSSTSLTHVKNIPSSPVYGEYKYLTDDSACKSLFNTRSVFNSRHSTDKQVDFTRVSIVWFTGSFPTVVTKI